jgi:site-specific DNA-methyltransferase (adenine-specific)
METKFLRFMVGVLKVSQNIYQTVYRFVPIQDFTQEWTDEKLYKKYGLTDSEIEYIENSIKPMADTVEEITTE